MADQTISLLPAGTLISERFAVQRALGRGGMASVYEAHDVRLRQRVAVKVLSTMFAQDPAAVQRFLGEARAVVCLRNQHVVRLIDAGTLPHGSPYLVMEFLDGKSLAAVLASEGPLPYAHVVEYTLQALEALAEAHRAGIVHRDLKPDNLMLIRGEDGLAQVKVIDFGISKLIGPDFTLRNLTLESSFLGSPLYASPEQLRDTGKVDVRTDIWSLGVVMYELLTGRPPFDARSPVALMTAICGATPLRVDDLRGDVPAALADVVMRCLEKDASRRYASAQDLAVALGPFAPDVRSRLSVEHVVRVQSSAPPPPPPKAQLPDEPVPTASMPPAWSTVTTGAPTLPMDRSSRKRVALLFAALVASAAIVLLSLRAGRAPRSERGPVVTARALAALPRSEAAPPGPPSAERVAQARSLPAPVVAPSASAAARTLGRPRVKTTQASPSAVAMDHTQPTSNEILGESDAGARVTARPARPLDTENPFRP